MSAEATGQRFKAEARWWGCEGGLPLRFPTGRARTALRALSALSAAVVLVAAVPAVTASHYDVTCSRLSPLSNECIFSIAAAHAGGISLTFDTAGPPPFSGYLEVKVTDSTPPPEEIVCGPFVAGSFLGACVPAGFAYTPGAVEVKVESKSLAQVGPGTGAWKVTVKN